jgi:hypothetical protein
MQSITAREERCAIFVCHKFDGLFWDFHISEISTTENLSGVLDCLSAWSYNRFANAFQSSESQVARQAKV